MSETNKTYLKFIFISLLIVSTFATFQFIYVFDTQNFNIKLIIVPVIVAIIFGSFIAHSILLKKELKQAQEELIEQAKLASLGHLVKSVAHEINTPAGNTLTLISVVHEQIHALATEIESDLPQKNIILDNIETINQSLKVMQTSMTQVSGLIQSFKSISADTKDSLTQIGLHTYIRDVVNTFSSEAKEKNVDIVIEINESITLLTYPSLLIQVLNQIIFNAMHHAFTDISSPKIIIQSFLEDEMVSLVIKDNGNGIQESFISKIFDPFSMQERKTDRVGLGLSIVNNIVHHNLQGNINVTNMENSGACFNIQLPLNVQV